MTALTCLLIGYVPGAVLYRLPVGHRTVRAALPFEERVFWAVALSVLQSSLVGLLLAIGGWYTFDRLLGINAAAAAAVVVAARHRLRFDAPAPRPTWTALVPVALLVLGAGVFCRVPPAEYVLGGRDPGVYLNEGIRLAQRGGTVNDDDLARSVPPPLRPLFFPPAGKDSTFTSRFMAFFLLDADRGSVVGQFPVGFPLWVAIGYGLNGLSGARAAPVCAALMGLAAVYFVGVRLFGRAAGATAAALLAINVAEVWYARDPNAEILLQPLVFTGLLAHVRATRDDDGMFAPVAALLLVVSAFTHVTGILIVGVMGAAALHDVLARGGRVRLSFWLPLVAGTLAAVLYLWRFIPPYFEWPMQFVLNLRPAAIAWGICAAVAGVVGLRLLRRIPATARDRWSGFALVLTIWALAAYAYLFRQATGTLAAHDADSLRTFTAFYFTPLALGASLVGVVVAARTFATTSAFLLLLSAMSVFFFYKIRIVPEHFWAARRVLAVTLPGLLLLVGAAAFAPIIAARGSRERWWRPLSHLRTAAGLLLVVVVAGQYLRATHPILRHVEFAGVIPHLERLAGSFGDHDLVLVESRGNSDVHILALPLAYIYGRNVLVFAEMAPRKPETRELLTWALAKFQRVYFLGSATGGVDLLWRSLRVANVTTSRFTIPEYEPAINAFPRAARLREFDLVRYEFLREPVTAPVFEVDIGGADDQYLQRFYAKERHATGTTFRWTRDRSTIAAVGLRPEHREVVLWMSHGGRPAGAGPAAVSVALDDRPLGQVVVGPDFAPYRFAIPPDLAAQAGQRDAASRLQLETTTWSPATWLGGSDTREFGVMLDRVEVH